MSGNASSTFTGSEDPLGRISQDKVQASAADHEAIKQAYADAGSSPAFSGSVGENPTKGDGKVEGQKGDYEKITDEYKKAESNA